VLCRLSYVLYCGLHMQSGSESEKISTQDSVIKSVYGSVDVLCRALLCHAVQVLEGSVPCPPAYKVTAVSVANKGEPFISGIPNSREAVQAFLDSVQSNTTTTTITTGTTSPTTDAAATAGVASAAAAAGAGAGSGAGLGWRVTDFMGPRDAVGRQLPHAKWDDAVPPILSFYSFASAEMVVSQQ
jgi:hypothetical protein